MKLVIVESPSKTKTIKQFLGSDYQVVASKGHIRDIKNEGIDNLGLDFNNNLKPIYTIIPKQYQVIKDLNKYASQADKIYLASDPDREGEAISWHLKETLNLEGKEVKRIEFNEITEPAILHAIQNPRDIDEKLVDSQETRKIIDRIIGYKLSSLLKKSIGSQSAGRVQSAALKMITQREDEVQKFVPKRFFEIEASTKEFKAKLLEIGKNKAAQFDNEAEAKGLCGVLTKNMVVRDVTYYTKYEKSQPPFTTSTLIQTALNRFNLTSKKTMAIANELYVGIEIESKHIALITYMRTDSTRLSDEFISKQLIPHISANYGKDYLGKLHNYNNNKDTQDAHEAIRPVSLNRTPDSLKGYLTKDQLNIYTLIYERTIESMMKDAIIESKNVKFDSNGQMFGATFDKYSFLGFREANKSKELNEVIFDKNIGDVVTFDSINVLSKETEGPQRFTEATLIKEMESSGIGRPSTYASTIETLKDREYISIEKKKIVPTTQGILTSKFLDQYFNKFVDISYTAKMEKELDEIAKGNASEANTVNTFYSDFINQFNDQKTQIKPVETGDRCPICGSKMVFRSNSFGLFEACSNYPSCKYIKKEEVQQKVEIECPNCHEGHLVERIAKSGPKKGKKFYGCSNYPKCNYTTTTLSIKKK